MLGQIGNFSSEIGKKKHTFWHWEWGRISAPKSGDQGPWYFMGLGTRLTFDMKYMKDSYVFANFINFTRKILWEPFLHENCQDNFPICRFTQIPNL